MGSTRPLDAFTFIFQETEWGPFIAHAYQYEAGRSTWIFETDPETFKRAGLEGLSETAIRRPDGGDFRLVPRGASAPDQPLDVAQFPDDPQQALGQGQHGAARRRQGDRAFLDRLRHQACDGRCHRAGGRHAARADGRGRACSNTRTAAARRSRRPSTPPTCRWSGSSMSTASGISIPVQFAFGVMTRAKAITYDNLTLRAPDFVAEVDKAFARQVRASGFRRRCREAGGADVPAVAVARDGDCQIARWCRRCACIRPRKACPAISIWCITARARSAAPA